MICIAKRVLYCICKVKRGDTFLCVIPMAEAMVVSTVASCVVTELIKTVITCAQKAKKCKSECRKLEKELKAIEPDVEKIERRLAELRERACHGYHEDVRMVENWLERLKDAIVQANSEVDKCNSSRFKFDSSLSTRITALYETITKAADNRIVLFLQLKNYSGPHGVAPPVVAWYDSPGESVHLRMTRERNEALRREDQTRLSMNGSPSSPYFSQDPGNGYDSASSSSFFGDESSVHSSSSSGYDSSGSPYLRLMNQQRNEALQREDRTRSSMGQMERRYTLDNSSYAPHQHQQHHDSNRMSYPWYTS